MTGAIYRCETCGREEHVDFYARGFPPDAAKRKLIKKCKTDDCACSPAYRAGFGLTPRGM